MTRLTRREFATGALAGGVALPLSARGEVTSGSRVRVGSVSELAIGQPVSFVYPEPHRAMLVRLARPAEHGVGPGGDIVAFHVACPHQGCPVVSNDAERLGRGVFGPCACHGSTFDISAHGRQIHGRASQDLVRVVLEVRDDDIFAVGIVGLPFGDAVRSPS